MATARITADAITEAELIESGSKPNTNKVSKPTPKKLNKSDVSSTAAVAFNRTTVYAANRLKSKYVEILDESDIKLINDSIVVPIDQAKLITDPVVSMLVDSESKIAMAVITGISFVPAALVLLDWFSSYTQLNQALKRQLDMKMQAAQAAQMNYQQFVQ